MKTIRNQLVISISLILTVLLLPVNAAPNNGGVPAFSHTLVYGSFYTIDLRHRFRVVLRNYNESADIKIDRARIYFKDGRLAFDSDVLGYLPAGNNDIINPENNVLQPHQTEQYNSERLFGYLPDQIPPVQQGHVQIVIDSSVTAPNADPLSLVTVRHLYDQNLSFMPISRSGGKCKILE